MEYLKRVGYPLTYGRVSRLMRQRTYIYFQGGYSDKPGADVVRRWQYEAAQIHM
jgi:hypothetical protein